ncbi:amino acid adenylation domain-containing protein [Chloroflexi bacterium TSY]|nr:amino acid adenylation domain-containing protein [Chloroflexi bacterium TSY]
MSSLTPSDQLLFERFGQGPIVTVPHSCIHHAFEAQAVANPHNIAAEHLGDSITYQELNRQADRLAALLAQHGVSTGDNVALFLQRSIPMLVGIFGILKAGAAYVPQHVGVAPEAQLRHIIDATSAKVILTISSLKHLVPVPEGHICIAIDELMQEPFDNTPATLTTFEPNTEVSRDNTCFVLFTSGTTGNPNGVQVTHGNVCNILLTEPGNLGMRPGLKVGQILSIAFDMAAWETLGALSHGATLVIRGKDIEETVRKVDIVIATPTILGSFDADQCKNVKVAAVAGEPCPQPLADKWASFCTFYNSCGPTETTIINTAQRYQLTSERLTIGKPTPNNTVYVLDEKMRPCAIGEVGEMWAGGDCVSAGYLDNDRLNAERYAPDPFLGGGRKMFRTRDLGRWTEDGELEHFGRTDDQVKICGFRVELDSVSTVLESVPSCTKAVTLKLNDRSLVSFVSPQSVDVDVAKQAVAAALPYYCTPAFVIAMDQFPMTSRGKVDKRMMLDMAKEHEAAQSEARSLALEQMMDSPQVSFEQTAERPAHLFAFPQVGHGSDGTKQAELVGVAS